MKKIVTILLIAIHFFYAFGYTLFFSVMENAADQRMMALLDNNRYDESDLVLLKFALYAPYIQSSGGYQRCDGQIELNGTQYNYVKRMVRNDTLYLYCIANKQKTDLNNTKNLYAQQHSDNSLDKKADQPSLKQFSFTQEYNIAVTEVTFNTHNTSLNKTQSVNNLNTEKGFILRTIQPPDLFI